MDADEKFSTFASVIDPVTGHAWTAYQNPEWSEMGVFVEVVPEDEWNAYSPGIRERVRVGVVDGKLTPGAGEPVEFMLHYKFFGEAPGSILLERVRIF
jgi:hypothetical protein